LNFFSNANRRLGVSMVYTAHKSTSLIDSYSIPQDCGTKHLDILAVIETLDPEKPDQWYEKTSAIADAVMAATSGLDLQKVTTAVAYDLEQLFQGYNNA